jgi:hypothetical protein
MATKERRASPASDNSDNESDDGQSTKGATQPKSSVTLSGILNAIDGITSQVRAISFLVDLS